MAFDQVELAENITTLWYFRHSMMASWRRRDGLRPGNLGR